MSNQLPSEFLISTSNTYLPINSSDELNNYIEFINGINYENSNDQRLRNGLIAIANGGDSNGDFGVILKYHASYYYKVYASLFTQIFHDELLKSGVSVPFKDLYDEAMRTKHESYKLRNQIQRTAENATKNWNYDSSELKDLYYRLQKNKDTEYQSTVDNNSTLLRQGQMNYDMFLRQMEWNQFLRLISACLCMILIIGFLASTEISPDLIRLFFISVFVIFITNCIMLYMASRKRHLLLYPRLRFPGYPIRDENTQEAHKTGDCTGSYDGSEIDCKYN